MGRTRSMHGKIRNLYKMLLEKSGGKGLLCRRGPILEYNIKTKLKYFRTWTGLLTNNLLH
jgi:hypothetical protein